MYFKSKIGLKGAGNKTLVRQNVLIGKEKIMGIF
jgi:hypothetical protein